MRIDKYLWAIRVFKSRSISTEACNSGKVTIAGKSVKASRKIKEGDIIEVKKSPAVFSYKVKELIGKRISAKMVENYTQDITPEEELEKIRLANMNNNGKRDRGTGRPTKKDRRLLDDFFG